MSWVEREPQVSHFTETGFWPIAKTYQSEPSRFSASPATSLSSETDVQALRRALMHLNSWPEAGDVFVELLAKAQGYGVTLVPSDFDWLPQVADAACKGEDIGSRYPSIFQKLLTYSDLREKFLQMLQVRSIEV